MGRQRAAYGAQLAAKPQMNMYAETIITCVWSMGAFEIRLDIRAVADRRAGIGKILPR